jgi:hypothetical protein
LEALRASRQGDEADRDEVTPALGNGSERTESPRVARQGASQEDQEVIRNDLFLPWGAVLDLAVELGAPAWIDDVGLRGLARQLGLEVMSTPALLRVLLEAGRISGAQHDEAVKALVEARVGDWPLHEEHLLEIAEDEEWRADTVAAVLARPASWRETATPLAFLKRVLPLVAAKRPDDLPAWVGAAISGLGLAYADQPAVAVSAAAGVLAQAIVVSHPAPGGVARLVTATRDALSAARPAQVHFGDPLPIAARLLRDAFLAAAPAQLVVSYVAGLFSELEERDRVAVLIALMLVVR